MSRLISLCLALLLAAVASAEQRYLVGTRGDASRGSRAALRVVALDDDSARSARRVREIPAFEGFAATLTDDEVAALRNDPAVRWIEPVLPRHALATAPKPQTIPWGIDAIRARDAAAGRPAGEINVVVIDSGIARFHPDLAYAWKGGFDFVRNTDSPEDESGHGTHVAGIIAAGDNHYGVIGVAPWASLWDARVLDRQGNGTTESVIRAVDWAIAKKRELGGNWILNLSLGSARSSFAERETFARAIDEGMIVVAASGNSSKPDEIVPVAFPAAYPGVVAVGAVDSARNVAAFSQQGPELDFVAPGVGVYSTVPSGHAAESWISIGGKRQDSGALEYSGFGTVTSEYVYCGLGRPGECPASVNGRIALIRRGDLTFAEKVTNAVAAGATAVLIFNHQDEAGAEYNWTLGQENDWPVVAGTNRATGEALVAAPAGVITIAVDPAEYGSQNGTSMATPHVTGAAALLWRMAPNATAAQIHEALVATAVDIGVPGLDPAAGHGLIDVYAAAKHLVPSAFDAPGTPSTGRRFLRRGGK